MNTLSELVMIDENLRFILFGISCRLGIDMNSMECDKIYSDMRDGQFSNKNYTLFSRKDLEITAVVDEYEPESIWIKIILKEVIDLKWIIEKAIYSAPILRNSP